MVIESESESPIVVRPKSEFKSEMHEKELEELERAGA